MKYFVFGWDFTDFICNVQAKNVKYNQIPRKKYGFGYYEQNNESFYQFFCDVIRFASLNIHENFIH